MYSNTFSQIKHIGSRFYRKKYHTKYEYFKSLNLIQSPKRLLDTLRPDLEQHKLLDTLPVFEPLGVKFESNIRTTVNTLQSPHFHIHNPKIEDHDIIFFKKVIGDIKMNLQIHFLNDKLFYIHNEIQHYLVSNYLKNEEILQLMLERYHAGQLKGMDNREVVLMDVNGSKIFTSNQVSFGINYLSGNTEHLEKAKVIVDHITKKKEAQDENQIKLLLNNI